MEPRPPLVAAHLAAHGPSLSVGAALLAGGAAALGLVASASWVAGVVGIGVSALFLGAWVADAAHHRRVLLRALELECASPRPDPVGDPRWDELLGVVGALRDSGDERLAGLADRLLAAGRDELHAVRALTMVTRGRSHALRDREERLERLIASGRELCAEAAPVSGPLDEELRSLRARLRAEREVEGASGSAAAPRPRRPAAAASPG